MFHRIYDLGRKIKEFFSFCQTARRDQTALSDFRSENVAKMNTKSTIMGKKDYFKNKSKKLVIKASKNWMQCESCGKWVNTDCETDDAPMLIADCDCCRVLCCRTCLDTEKEGRCVLCKNDESEDENDN